ncbi:MAG: alpha/beta fold hydrolase [Bacteroidia bacterium]|nr:alpha/beta fold hydrolase [Bacteroidia bacterium]MDW8134844.1 alpha/beta fold hydrolase [Bacteroidia bacterium]
MQLHFEKLGSGGPNFIFLHGFLGSLDNWRTIAKKLSLPGTTYLVDARNHGHSPHAESHTYADMTEDIKELMDSEKITHAHFLGHSMGGKTVMYLALNSPQNVDSVVIVDIAPRAYEGGHERLLSVLMRVDLRVTRREEVEAQLIPFIPEPNIRQFLMKGLARSSQGDFYWRWNLPVLVKAYPEVLREVEGIPYEGPALFLKGEYSPYIRPTDVGEIHRLFPKASILTIPNAGHWVHVDNPDRVVEILQEFWRNLI